MTLGPVEIVVVRIRGDQCPGDIAPALAELVESRMLRVIDILFVAKDEVGKVELTEIHELEDVDGAAFDPIVQNVEHLLAEEDALAFSALLDPGSSGVLLLLEAAWAIRLRSTLVNANAELVLNERIPSTVIEEIVAARAMSGA